MVPRMRHVWIGWALLWLVVGCSPFRKPDGLFTARRLPPLTTSADAIHLDVVFVERPLGDRLLGPDLWRQLDQTASLTDDARKSLVRGGFQVGVTGANPPGELQTLMGLTADFADEPSAEQEKKLVGRQTILQSGWSTEIQVGPSVVAREGLPAQQTWDSCRVPFYKPGAEVAVEKTLESVRCVYKVTAHRLQDGWVRLDFLPQVHYGVPGPVISPGESQFQLTYSQRVEDYPQLQFSLTLALGEMAVLTSRDLEALSLGRLFFVGPDDSRSQRLLVLRLANMGLADDPYRE